jgi:hypothetical protein
MVSWANFFISSGVWFHSGAAWGGERAMGFCFTTAALRWVPSQFKYYARFQLVALYALFNETRVFANPDVDLENITASAVDQHTIQQSWQTIISRTAQHPGFVVAE